MKKISPGGRYFFHIVKSVVYRCLVAGMKNSVKKDAKIFGGNAKRLYLCTRF